jgi:hypothetical protein
MGDETMWKSTPEKLFHTFYALSCRWPDHVWPRVDDDGESISVEVQPHIEDSVAERSACRCYYL